MSGATTTRRQAAIAGVAVLLSILGMPRPAPAVPNPLVGVPEEPGIHGHPLFDSWYLIDRYQEAEYFVSGTAENIAGTQTAPYTTRIIVTRPSAGADFNGTVLLDWVNVTAQFENAVDTIEAHEMLVRDGYAFVHVSAQAAGICCSPLTPKVWDPVRYESLSHPGDAYSYDIFSQVAQALRAPLGLDPMGGLHVERVIAAGQSQSADFLSTYVRQVQQSAGVIDGFLIHGRGSKTFATAPLVPVLHLLSDAEAAPAGPSVGGSTTPPFQNYSLWEIAGSSHSDFWIDYHQEFGQGPRTLADAPKQEASADEEMHAVAGNYGEQIHPKQFTCIIGGSLFPMRYATSAAISTLDQWVRTGTAPGVAPRFAFDPAGQLARDMHGNALGGIRLPPIDVPVATYVSTICALGGITLPFSEAQLRLLYPTHADYYSKMKDATTPSVSAGYLLPEDAEDLLERACAAKVRWQDLSAGPCS